MIDRLQKFFNEALFLNKTEQDEFDEQKRYYNGDQLPNDVKMTLQERGQPMHWENIYQKIGNKIMGFKITSRQEVRVLGRQREDRDVASILTDIFRTIVDSTDYALNKKNTDLDIMLGCGVFEVFVTELDEFDSLGNSLKDIKIEHIPKEAFLIDPYSQKANCSDSRYFHKILEMDYDTLFLYFDEESVLNLRRQNNSYNSYRDRVVIIESWIKEVLIEQKSVVWKRYYWSDNIVLKEEIDPYKINNHPFVIRRLNVDENNKSFGIFRNIKPIQDSINFSILRIQNMLGGTKLIIENDAVDDIETFKDEYAKDDAVVGVRNGTLMHKKIEHIKHNAEIAQLANLLVDYRRNAQDIVGVSDELLGMATNRLSGYAIEQRQNIGLVGLQQFIDASNEIDVEAFRKATLLITKYFTAEQTFKIVEKDQGERYFTINELQKSENGEIIRENGKPKMKNKISVGRYDIILKSIPQTQGSIAERYKQNVELLKLIGQTNPEMVKTILPYLLLDVDSPIALDVMQLIKNQEENMSKNPQVDEIKQLEMKKIDLELQKLATEVGINKAKSLKLVAEAQEESSRATMQENRL